MQQADIRHKIQTLEHGLITRKEELRRFAHLARAYGKQVKADEREIAELSELLLED